MVGDWNILYVLDLLGTAAFAFSGALCAIRRRPDAVGMMILATATAIGGGMIRDVLLGSPARVLADVNYLLVTLLSTIVCIFMPRMLLHRRKFFLYFDAFGLGVFSAIGAAIAIDRQMNPLSVLFIAAITGAGGGIVRDVLLGKMPVVLYRDIYISAVIAGAGLMIVIRLTPLPQWIAPVLAILATTAIRVLAIRYNWRLPRIGLAPADTGSRGSGPTKTGRQRSGEPE
jgi:uncharacterized membrane protein YeiH